MTHQSLPGIPWFNFPVSCRVDQRIGKALFADNGPLTPADRRTFRNEIEEIVCSYVLDENHGIMLTPYSDEEHDYTCLAQIDVFLKKPEKAVRVAELCHRAMPYPLIVILHETTENTELHRNEKNIINTLPCSSVFFCGSDVMFSMAEKRFSRDGKEQVVLERFVYTEWMQEEKLADFRNAVDFSKNRKLGFRDLYRHYITLLDVLQCAGITGKFKESGLSPEERRSLLAELHHLNQQLAELKAAVKKTTELSQQVDLNMQAQKITHEIQEIHKKI